MSEIILDTSFLVGLIDEGDIWHKKACEIYDVLVNNKIIIYFLDCVVNETVAVISRRYSRIKREDLFTEIFDKFEELVKPEIINWTYDRIREFYPEIINLVKGFKGKFSFHDAFIALIARENKISYIASFDEDFDMVERLVRIKDKESVKL